MNKIHVQKYAMNRLFPPCLHFLYSCLMNIHEPNHWSSSTWDCFVHMFTWAIKSDKTNDCRFDFYLVSQHSLQGTVSPTHYNVIHDELNWTAKQYQWFTYMMTHLYYNWPVSSFANNF